MQCNDAVLAHIKRPVQELLGPAAGEGSDDQVIWKNLRNRKDAILVGVNQYIPI